MPIEISAGIILFRKNKEVKYLILYKPKTKHYSESWSFPKGNLDLKEKALETAQRELREETGIKDIELIPEFKETISFFYKKKNKTIHKKIIYFLAKTKRKTIKVSYEHKDYGWFKYKQALQKLTFENNKNLLKKAHKEVKKCL